MRYLVFGAGAIGTYIGGSLALSGQPVVFLERPEGAAGLRDHGLRLALNGEPKAIPQPVLVETFAQALAQGPFDLAILAVKSYDTQSLLDSLGDRIIDVPPILDLQNGVDNEAVVASRAGQDKVIPGTVTSAIGRLGPGAIRLERLRGVGVGGSHAVNQRLLQDLNHAELNAHEYADGTSMKWSKMITNLLANASSAILDMTPAEIFSDPRLYKLEIAQVREALRVMRALHMKVIDLPGTPVRLLAWAVQYLPESISRPFLYRAVGAGRGGKMPSFHIDLHAGRGKSEVEYLNGAVVRHGEDVGIQTPVNQALTELLTGLTEGRIPLSEYAHQPDKVLSIIGII